MRGMEDLEGDVRRLGENRELLAVRDKHERRLAPGEQRADLLAVPGIVEQQQRWPVRHLLAPELGTVAGLGGDRRWRGPDGEQERQESIARVGGKNAGHMPVKAHEKFTASSNSRNSSSRPVKLAGT
ncbi:MAG TPA: hypothetical protein VKG80_13095 [Trebonia sp.]|nr:hypothetical protein [Trebonia sp.]